LPKKKVALILGYSWSLMRQNLIGLLFVNSTSHTWWTELLSETRSFPHSNSSSARRAAKPKWFPRRPIATRLPNRIGARPCRRIIYF